MRNGASINTWRAFGVLTLLVFAVYGRSLGNDFVFDDAIFMERDRRLESTEGIAKTFTQPLWAFTDEPGQLGVHHYYRPLQLLPLAVSRLLFDGSPWPAHLASLLLHAVNATLVYVLLRRSAANAAVSFALAAVFALHPANSEAVLWASDIAGLGATACLLALVLVHGSTLGAWRAPLLVAPLALVATLFKESGVLALPLLLASDVAPPAGRRASRGITDYAAVLGALGVYLWLRTRALGGLLPGADALELSRVELVLNAFAILPSFVVTFLWPFDLNMYRDFQPARGLTDLRVPAGIAVAAAVSFAALLARRRRPPVAFGLAWTAITIVPHVIVRWPQLNAFAERYLYLPSIGLYAAAAAPLSVLLARTPGRVQVSAAASAAVLLVIFAARDAARVGDWIDEITLYSRTLEQSERAELIRNNLALRYLHLGRAREGVPIQRELLRIDPDFPNGWHNLGLLLLAAEDRAGARDAFERSAALEPRNAATALNLGYVYDLDGRREEAVVQYFRAAALAQHDPKPWYNLAVIAHEQRQLGNARRAAEEVLARSPSDDAARGLLAAIERSTSAASAERDPARTLHRCREAREAAASGRALEAVARLRAAAWLDERAALPHHYLANLAYLGGRTEEAASHERAALERDPSNDLYRANLAALADAVRSEHTGASAAAGDAATGFRAEPGTSD